MLMIDAFTHILPPKYLKARPASFNTRESLAYNSLFSREALIDIDTRLRMMDRFDGYFQILNIAVPPVEDMVGPKEAVDLAKVANDGMAELVFKYPDRFLGAMACLPLNNMDAAMKELDRAILQLGFKGVQITSSIMDKPLDSPEFDPLFEKMNKYDLPIQIHPRHIRGKGDSATIDRDYPNDCGWPYDTTLCMNRLVYGGVLHKYPNLKILTHHCGGLAPYQAARIFRGQSRVLNRQADRLGFSKTIEEYYKMFYGDTAMWGWTPGLMCGYAFFGPDHVLFGTDTPYGPRGGEMFIRDSIRSIGEMTIPEEDKKKIFELNARKLFKIAI